MRWICSTICKKSQSKCQNRQISFGTYAKTIDCCLYALNAILQNVHSLNESMPQSSIVIEKHKVFILCNSHSYKQQVIFSLTCDFQRNFKRIKASESPLPTGSSSCIIFCPGHQVPTSMEKLYFIICPSQHTRVIPSPYIPLKMQN